MRRNLRTQVRTLAILITEAQFTITESFKNSTADNSILYWAAALYYILRQRSHRSRQA